MRRAIVLHRNVSDEDVIGFDVLLWIAVPADQQADYVNPDFVSALPDDLINPDPDAAAEEMLALREGRNREVVEGIGVEKRAANGSLRTRNQLLQAMSDTIRARYLWYQGAQAALKITFDLYGSFYDDTNGRWTLRDG